MSKKSSTFALEMKKAYYIPTIEIIRVETERLMGMGDTSGHISGGSSVAPPRQEAPVF